VADDLRTIIQRYLLAKYKSAPEVEVRVAEEEVVPAEESRIARRFESRKQKRKRAKQHSK